MSTIVTHGTPVRPEPSGAGQNLGVLDEVGGLVDQLLYGVGGFAEAGVEAVAFQG